MKTILLKIIRVSILLFTFLSCLNNKDPFYTTRGGWDYQRIPLIKPYFIGNAGNGWSVCKPFYKMDGGSIDGISDGITEASKIQIVDSIILIQWNQDTSITKYPDTTWCFIIVPLKIEAKFTDEQKYLDSLKHYTDISPKYRDIQEVWKQYVETDYLEWFPDKYKPDN